MLSLTPKIIVNAVNIHHGGGAVLLDALLQQLPADPVVLFHDERFLPPKAEDLTAISVKPSLWQRYLAEKKMAKLANDGDQLFCFGNQPPLFPSKAEVTLYLQNALLVNDYELSEYPLRSRLVLTMAKSLLNRYIHHVDNIWVQTTTMQHWTKAKYKNANVSVNLFLPPMLDIQTNAETQYDFIYIANLDPHKNHHGLITAWKILAEQNIRPSLILNTSSGPADNLLAWIKQQQKDYQLNLHFIKQTSHDEILKYYTQSHALIYPSYCESLGLPLLEAQYYGLPIVASDLSYVHDIVTPVACFDPGSPEQIASVVKDYITQKTTNHHCEKEIKISVLDPSQVWSKLMPAS